MWQVLPVIGACIFLLDTCDTYLHMQKCAFEPLQRDGALKCLTTKHSVYFTLLAH